MTRTNTSRPWRPLKALANVSESRCDQGRRNGVHYGGTATLTFERGGNGGTSALHNSIISNLMIYQDRLETNLLQLFAPT